MSWCVIRSVDQPFNGVAMSLCYSRRDNNRVKYLFLWLSVTKTLNGFQGCRKSFTIYSKKGCQNDILSKHCIRCSTSIDGQGHGRRASRPLQSHSIIYYSSTMNHTPNSVSFPRHGQNRPLSLSTDSVSLPTTGGASPPPLSHTETRSSTRFGLRALCRHSTGG